VKFELNDDQRMLQEGAARFFEKSYEFKQRLELARHGGGFSRETWQAFADMGWLAAAIPEQHGGLGFGAIEAAFIAEQVGRHLVLEPFTMCAILPISIIVNVADDAQKDALLPVIASGEQIVAVACSEPEARGNVTHVSCRAERTTAGDWRLNGRKSLVVAAPVADSFLIVARTQGEVDAATGVSVFSIASGVAGLHLEPYALVDGTPAADLVFDDVIVPASALLGQAGVANAGLQQAADEAIVAQCAEAVGGIEDVLALCSEYLKTRKQFGIPIGSFQALQHRMADMAIEASQARASLHLGLQALTQGVPQRRSVDVSGVKAQVLKSARFVTQQGIQLHGGYGITEEYRVGHHWRRLLLTDSLLGSMSYHLSRYAGRIRDDMNGQAGIRT
jgi:alkylation response protein AidB-like acyl-CoA dehydrogenase